MNQKAYTPNYYSLDDIFVTQERVPCVSIAHQKKLGFLDPGSETADLQSGQKVDLPLWYCLAISTARNPTFRINIPDIYKNAYKDICAAEATVVDLGKLNKYFYEFGRYVARFDRTGSVGQMLYETSRVRMKHLKDLCRSDAPNEVASDHRLEFVEKLLFAAGCSTNQKYQRWLEKDDTSEIKASEMVVNYRKRKRSAMEND